MTEQQLNRWYKGLSGLTKAYLYSHVASLEAYSKAYDIQESMLDSKTSMSHNITKAIGPISDYEIDKFEDYINGK